MNTVDKIRVMSGFFERLNDLKTRLESVEQRTRDIDVVALMKRGWSMSAIEALEYGKLLEDRKKVIADYESLLKDWADFNQKHKVCKEPNDS